MENTSDRLQKIGRKTDGEKMNGKVIEAKSGTYGRVQITLLKSVKDEILSWSKELGVNQAAFLKMALMIGASQLCEMIILNEQSKELDEFLAGK